MGRPFREADCSRHPLYQVSLPSKMTWLRCEACEHVYTDGYWDAEALETIFGQTHANQRPGGSDMEQGRHISSRMVDRIVHSGIQDGRWLDVGCGNGALLLTALEYGFSPVGLDLRESTVRELRQIGVEAYRTDVAEFADQRNFAVVSLADVLEHMPFPKAGLQAVRKLIDTDGRLLVSLPAMGCPLWDYLDAQNVNPYWGEIEHYHNFSRDRLYALLRETGFEPLTYGISERYRVCMEAVARPV